MSGVVGIPLDKNFSERCAKQQRVYYDGAEGPYSEFLGDYDQAALAGNGTDVLTVQDFLIDRVRMRLNAPRKYPVTVIDVGGGVSVTWLNLAAEFESKVKSGDLQLLVTMLRGTPQDYLESALNHYARFGLKSAPLRDAWDLYNEYGDLVYYVNTGFHKNEGLFLAHPDPEVNRSVRIQANLEGNVDVVHEHKAVTGWNKVPEQSILHLGRLVSDQGLYMVNRRDMQGSYGYVSNSWQSNQEEMRGRNRGIQAAHAMLSEQMGLVQVDVVEAGHEAGLPMTYRIFRGAQAAPVGAGYEY